MGKNKQVATPNNNNQGISPTKIFKTGGENAALIFHSICRNSSKSYDNNEGIRPDLINRNPRSMELMRLARKSQGFPLDTPTITYYYRLMFEVTHKYTTAWVENNAGKVLISASTKEWPIRKHLYSAKDVAAAQNIGSILARRCLQAGILEIHTELEELAERSQKINMFLESFKNGGMKIGEDPHIRERESYPTYPKKPAYSWEVTEEEVNRIPPELITKYPRRNPDDPTIPDEELGKR